jgi:hypothetical protein
MGRSGFTEAFIVFIMVIIMVMYVRSYYGEVEIVSAPDDGRRYVVRKLPDARQAAKLLARINAKLSKLVQHMIAKFPNDPAVRRLHDNYNPEALSEGGHEVGYTSYSVNKGEKIVMCLRQPDESFVEENVLVYVAVHELGHLMTDEVGHTPKFWANFKRLAAEAIEIGVYVKVDFGGKPQPYCGISIASSVV